MRYVLLAAATALCLSLPAQAQARRLSCSSTSEGPCQTADAFDYFTVPSAPGLVLTNFGLLFPGDRTGEWQVVCDDNFGLATPDRVRLSADGEVFAASNLGLYLSGPDGCTWTQAKGDLAGKPVLDVAFDPLDREVVWALGDTPRVLWRSTDRGRTFVTFHVFADGLGYYRLAVAPSDRQHLYLVGVGREGATPFAWSTDGGQTFMTGDLKTGANPPPTVPFIFYAVAPDDPRSLYFVVLDTAGDQLWRSTDGGHTTSRLFTLRGRDAFGGLAFGSSSQTLYLAGTDPFPLAGNPPGRLHISRDGGKTWEEPILSGERGPRYSCLASGGDKLYACGPGELDDFLVGVSSDEGKTWTSVAGLKQVTGVKSCVRPRCATTEAWLCDTYGRCPEGVTPSTVDAGTRPAGDAADAAGCVGGACGEEHGCSCHLSGRPERPAGSAWSILAALAFSVGRSCRSRRVNAEERGACQSGRRTAAGSTPDPRTHGG